MSSILTRSRHFARAALLALSAGLFPAVAAAQDPAPPPTADAAPDDTASGPPVSPLGALGRSLVLPGWGQAAVDAPERGAVYFALEAASLFMVFKTQAKLNAARRGLPEDAGLVQARLQQREDWIALAAFWALFSGVDAWVTTHMWGFEGEIRPPQDGSLGMELGWSVPARLP